MEREGKKRCYKVLAASAGLAAALETGGEEIGEVVPELLGGLFERVLDRLRWLIRRRDEVRERTRRLLRLRVRRHRDEWRFTDGLRLLRDDLERWRLRLFFLSVLARSLDLELVESRRFRLRLLVRLRRRLGDRFRLRLLVTLRRRRLDAGGLRVRERGRLERPRVRDGDRLTLDLDHRSLATGWWRFLGDLVDLDGVGDLRYLAMGEGACLAIFAAFALRGAREGAGVEELIGATWRL